MKKILLVTLTFLTLNVFSQKLTERQIENTMNEYMQFLKDEGYSPSFSETGELDFKYEGGTYTIEEPKYSEDFAMYTGLNNNDGCTFGTLSAVNAACGGTATSQIWLSKSCKTVFIQYTSFIESSTNFKLLFKEALRSVKFGKELIKEKYTEYNPK
jgi:hypothetical protein